MRYIYVTDLFSRLETPVRNPLETKTTYLLWVEQLQITTKCQTMYGSSQNKKSISQLITPIFIIYNPTANNRTNKSRLILNTHTRASTNNPAEYIMKEICNLLRCMWARISQHSWYVARGTNYNYLRSESTMWPLIYQDWYYY